MCVCARVGAAGEVWGAALLARGLGYLARAAFRTRRPPLLAPGRPGQAGPRAAGIFVPASGGARRQRAARKETRAQHWDSGFHVRPPGQSREQRLRLQGAPTRLAPPLQFPRRSWELAFHFPERKTGREWAQLVLHGMVVGGGRREPTGALCSTLTLQRRAPVELGDRGSLSSHPADCTAAAWTRRQPGRKHTPNPETELPNQTETVPHLRVCVRVCMRVYVRVEWGAGVTSARLTCSTVCTTGCPAEE